MSIVLEALEKTQREGIREKKKEPFPQREPVKDISLHRVKKPSRRQGIYFLVIILCVTAVNLWFLNRWLNRNKATVSVNVSTPVNPPTISLIPQESGIFLETGYPVLTVTGIVWDPQEPIVLVNGEFLKEGDEILGAVVKEIKLNRVTFLYKNEEFTLAVEQ